MTNFQEWLFSRPEYDTPEKRANAKKIWLTDKGIAEERGSFLESLPIWSRLGDSRKYKEVDEVRFSEFINLERLELWSDGIDSWPVIIKKLDLSRNPKLKELKLLSGCLPLYLDVSKNPNLNKIVFDSWYGRDSSGQKILDLRNNPLRNNPNLLSLELMLKTWGKKTPEYTENGAFIISYRDKVCSHIFEEWEKSIKELSVKKEKIEKAYVKITEKQKRLLTAKILVLKQKIQQEERFCNRLDKFLNEVEQLTQLQKYLPTEQQEILLVNNSTKITKLKQKLSAKFTEQEIQEIQQLQEDLTESESEIKTEARILVQERRSN